MSRHRLNRDSRGQFALAITVNAAVFGGLGVLGMALTPLPTTLTRDLTSPPAAHAPVPTRPLDVLPGMGAGLELVRWPRGLDKVAVKTPIHESVFVMHERKGGARSEGGSADRSDKGDGYVGRHRAEVRHLQAHHDHFERGSHRGHDHGAGSAGGMGDGHHRERSGRHHVDGSGDFHGHPSDSGGNQHHRHDGNVGEHHQGSHSQGGHHAEHGGDHR